MKNKNNFLLGKYKVLTDLENIHRIDSEEAILGTGAHFAEFGIKM